MSGPRVAVIGAGVLGLTTLKNLREEGFDAIAFDKNEYIGGLWHFTEDETTTSVTEYTEWNSCMQMSCYTDFPFPPGTPDFPTLAQIQSYLDNYCEKFSLGGHIKLQHNVQRITRDEQENSWALEYIDPKGEQRQEKFDKIIMAVGQAGKRLMPLGISGLDNFKGKVLHGQSFKRGSDYEGRKVLLLGSSNTAMDCAVELCGFAEKIYLSHRHGGVIIPRYYKSVPAEFAATLRMMAVDNFLGDIAPTQWATVFNWYCLTISNESFGPLPTAWRFNIPPKGQMFNPIINDRIVDKFHNGEVLIVQSIRQVLPSGEIELVDGELLSDVDTLILCTGYDFDYSLLPDSANPIGEQNVQWVATPRSGGRLLANLYQGIFSLNYPQSLAFIGVSGFPASQMPLFDLVSMAIAQVWKGTHSLPSRAEMEREVVERHACTLKMAGERDGPAISPGRVDIGPWMYWLHDVAGTGFNENLGYGFSGWLFWLCNFSFCSSLMNGINSPHLWRLFDGKRKKWDGAMEAIKQVNEDAKRRKRAAALAGKTMG